MVNGLLNLSTRIKIALRPHGLSEVPMAVSMIDA
jgi:hypothetical protein